MATYLLLRNNKEHGPLSLQHLIQMGLKPYDLVWVQGKSAAWLYSSEIAELKPYSPIVEEQPSNRSFKKPDSTKTNEEIVFPTESVKQPDFIKVNKEIVFPAEAVKQPDLIKVNKEIIFPVETIKQPDALKVKEEITFPEEITKKAEPIKQNVADKKDNWADIVFPDEVEKQPEELHSRQDVAEHEKYFPKKTVYVTMPMQQLYEPKQEPVFNIQTSPATNTREEPVAMETKYSQPLDEIKEMYVKKLQDRKQQSAKKKFIKESLKKAAILIGIISVGVLIGFAIKPNGSEKIASTNSASLITSETAAAISDEPGNETVQEEMPPTNTNETIEKRASDKKINNEPVSEQKPLVEKKVVIPAEKQAITEKKNATSPGQKVNEEKDLSIEREPSQGVEINAATGERIKQTRGNNIFRESKERSTSPQKNLKEYVSIKSNDYHIVAFGGIRNLQLTVNNDSKYALDNVLVEVQYLKPNDQFIKIENVSFKSVAPNASLTIRVPDTNRGMKVKYRIMKVESKEFNSDMAGL